MQKFVAVGNLTKNVESGKSKNGIAWCRFSIAVGRRFEKDKADFFNVATWRGQAENCAKYLQKGNKVAITGEVHINEKDGKYYTEIAADEVEFLTPKGKTTINDMTPCEEDDFQW